MTITHLLMQIIALAVAGTITVIFAYFLLKSDIQNYFRFKSLILKKDQQSALLPLKLQAYERMIIFIDRINPANLLLRLHQPSIGIAALQELVLNEIRSEFQHNITQQLYIDSTSWDILRKLKDDTIAMVNNVVQNLNDGATGVDVGRKILQHMSTIEENPYDLTIKQLKKDIQEMF